jgi:hypothetical protein
LKKDKYYEPVNVLFDQITKEFNYQYNKNVKKNDNSSSSIVTSESQNDKTTFNISKLIEINSELSQFIEFRFTMMSL